ncbi:MAG: class I SAM-dependent methyltransferase, partial [Dehalococcoidia bacterium]
DDRLHFDYFDMHRLEYEGQVEFQLTYGDWIRLFRANGLDVEDLIETRPPPGASSTYRSAEHAAWARRWPDENIWKARKRRS